MDVTDERKNKKKKKEGNSLHARTVPLVSTRHRTLGDVKESHVLPNLPVF